MQLLEQRNGFRLPSLLFAKGIYRMQLLPQFSFEFVTIAQTFGNLPAGIQQAALTQHGAMSLQLFISGRQGLQATLIAVCHKLPQCHDANEDGKLLFV